jgi:hypothetical protein
LRRLFLHQQTTPTIPQWIWWPTHGNESDRACVMHNASASAKRRILQWHLFCLLRNKLFDAYTIRSREQNWNDVRDGESHACSCEVPVRDDDPYRNVRDIAAFSSSPPIATASRVPACRTVLTIMNPHAHR